MTEPTTLPIPTAAANAAGYAVLVAARDGRCLYSPNIEGLTDAYPWELCWDEKGRAALREAFIQACMFRRRQCDVPASLRIGDRAFDFEVTLEPTGADLVIGRLVRVFSSRLSRREKDILSLVAGGASNSEISRLLSAEEATIRSHLRNIREKLGVARPEGLLLAAVGLGEVTPGNASA